MVTAVSAPFPPRIDMLPYVPPGPNIDIGLCLIDNGYQPFVQTSDLFAFWTCTGVVRAFAAGRRYW
jgi:hypothetical protein